MNPWEIVSWIGAIAVAVVIIGVLFVFVRSIVKPVEHPVDRALKNLGRPTDGRP